MNTIRLFKMTALGLVLLGPGLALAQDAPTQVDPLQAREQARHIRSEERSAWREQQQERVRNMTPEERALMRESSVDGRARMENRQGQGGEQARQRQRDGSGQGSGYGQGYQNRQGQGSGMAGGMGGGRGGRGGR